MSLQKISYGVEQQLLTNMKVDGTKEDVVNRVMMLSLMEHIQNPRCIILLLINPGVVLKAPMFVGADYQDVDHFECFDDCLHPNHEATDFYHHYKEDIALMAEMGFKCFRIIYCLV